MHEGRIYPYAACTKFQGQFRQDRTENPRYGRVHRLSTEMLGMDRRSFGVRIGFGLPAIA